MGDPWKRANVKTYFITVPAAGAASGSRDINTYTTDKSVARSILEKVRRLREGKLRGEPPAPDLIRWLEITDRRLVARLIELSVVDARQAAGFRPLLTHIDDYIADCRHHDQDDVHIANKASQLRKLAESLSATRLSDLTCDAVSGYLHGIRSRPKGNSARTVNHHRNTFVAFMNWCVMRGRMPSNPLESLAHLNEETDRRRRRRALTPDEFGRLLLAAPEARRLFYLASLYSGARRGELKLLTVGDVDLDRGTIRFPARVSKARRVDVVELHPQAIDALRAHIPVGAKATDLLFPRVPTRRTIYRDLARAGIERVNEKGEVVDLHALRKTLATFLLRNGVPPSIARRVTRHRLAGTLERSYDGLTNADARRAVDQLPSISTWGATAPTSATGDPSIENAPQATVSAAPEVAVESAVFSPPQPAILRAEMPAEGHGHVVLMAVGDPRSVCYTAVSDNDLPPAAPACSDQPNESAQVLILRAISASG